MTSLRSTMEANVARGVALLDEKDPHWWNGKDTPPVIERMVGHIDLEKLDMGSGFFCVLGQRHKDYYYYGTYAVGIGDGGGEKMSAYGFLPLTKVESSILTELWASVVQSRRFPRRKIAKDPWVKRVNKTWVRR